MNKDELSLKLDVKILDTDGAKQALEDFTQALKNLPKYLEIGVGIDGNYPERGDLKLYLKPFIIEMVKEYFKQGKIADVRGYGEEIVFNVHNTINVSGTKELDIKKITEEINKSIKKSPVVFGKPDGSSGVGSCGSPGGKLFSSM